MSFFLPALLRVDMVIRLYPLCNIYHLDLPLTEKKKKSLPK
jgi:hypothetical protein